MTCRTSNPTPRPTRTQRLTPLASPIVSALALLAAGSALPAAVAAQSGTIRYERSVTRTAGPLAQALIAGGGPAGARDGVGGDVAARRRAAAGGAARGRGDVPGGGAAGPGARRGGGSPPQEYAVLTLTFDGMVGLTTIEPMEIEGPASGATDAGPGGAGGQRAAALRRRLDAGLAARGMPGIPDQRTTAVWMDQASGERIDQIDFMTRDFRVRSTPEPLAWRLLGEESEYLGYVVQKAVAERDSSTIEAWFTVDVPGFAAPEGYTGLPGVVLMVSVDRGQTLIQAVEVDVDGAVDTPEAPSEGDEVTAEEFDALVAEKVEEFRTQMQSLRRRGGGGGS
jgi:hypothetical protein